MKRFSALIVAAVVGGVVSAQAQSWVAMPTASNGGSVFWDNTSTDGTQCNVGYVLEGIAGSAGNPCNNQHPSDWLPFSGTTPTTNWEGPSGSFATFSFTAGDYVFSLLPGTGAAGGDIAGDNPENWGWVDLTTNAKTDLGTTDLSSNYLLSTTDPWALYIELSNGTYAYSNADNQFALFGYGQPAPEGTYVAGMEDIYTGTNGGSDADYQDVLFQIVSQGPGIPESTTPEPMTMSLMAFGLVGLGGAQLRRRRNNKV